MSNRKIAGSNTHADKVKNQKSVNVLLSKAVKSNLLHGRCATMYDPVKQPISLHMTIKHVLLLTTRQDNMAY